MIKQTRVDIDKIFQSIPLIGISKELSSAITSAQVAKMWLGKVLNEQGAKNPYPDSKNPENTEVEPTADQSLIDYLDQFKAFETIQTNNTTKGDIKNASIKKLKFLRSKIDIVVSKLKLDLADKIPATMWETVYEFEAIKQIELSGMWLGMELSRISEAK